MNGVGFVKRTRTSVPQLAPSYPTPTRRWKVDITKTCLYNFEAVLASTHNLFSEQKYEKKYRSFFYLKIFSFKR